MILVAVGDDASTPTVDAVLAAVQRLGRARTCPMRALPAAKSVHSLHVGVGAPSVRGTPLPRPLIGVDEDLAGWFAAGADDAVRPAAVSKELRIRGERQLRRQSGVRLRVAAPALVLEPNGRVIRAGDVQAELTRTEFAILSHLVENAGRWVSPDELLTRVVQTTHQENTLVRVHIHHIREKLGAFAACLETRRTLGYRFRWEDGARSASG